MPLDKQGQDIACVSFVLHLLRCCRLNSHVLLPSPPPLGIFLSFPVSANCKMIATFETCYNFICLSCWLNKLLPRQLVFSLQHIWCRTAIPLLLQEDFTLPRLWVNNALQGCFFPFPLLFHMLCNVLVKVLCAGYMYSVTPLIRTPLGPTQSVLISEVSWFQGLFSIRKIHSGPHTVSALQWMSIFQGCPQGGIPLYVYLCTVSQMCVVHTIDMSCDRCQCNYIVIVWAMVILACTVASLWKDEEHLFAWLRNSLCKRQVIGVFLRSVIRLGEGGWAV